MTLPAGTRAKCRVVGSGRVDLGVTSKLLLSGPVVQDGMHGSHEILDQVSREDLKGENPVQNPSSNPPGCHTGRLEGTGGGNGIPSPFCEASQRSDGVESVLCQRQVIGVSLCLSQVVVEDSAARGTFT